MSCSNDRWITANENGQFHLYNGFINGDSGILRNNKISILGLVLTFIQLDGSLNLTETDFGASSEHFLNLDENLKGMLCMQVKPY